MNLPSDFPGLAPLFAGKTPAEAVALLREYWEWKGREDEQSTAADAVNSQEQ